MAQIPTNWEEADRLADEIGRLEHLWNHLRDTMNEADACYEDYGFGSLTVDAINADMPLIHEKIMELKAAHDEWVYGPGGYTKKETA